MTVMLPPPQFDHPYDGPVIVQSMSAVEVARMCHGDIACVIVPPNFPGDKCYVVLPQIGRGGTTEQFQKVLLRHETGHCNGWTKDHKDGV